MQPASPGLSRPGIFITDMRKQANTQKLRLASHDPRLPFSLPHPCPPPGADIVPFLIFRCSLQPEAELAVLPRSPAVRQGAHCLSLGLRLVGMGQTEVHLPKHPPASGAQTWGGVGIQRVDWASVQPWQGAGGSSVQLPGSGQSQSVTWTRGTAVRTPRVCVRVCARAWGPSRQGRPESRTGGATWILWSGGLCPQWGVWA